MQSRKMLDPVLVLEAVASHVFHSAEAQSIHSLISFFKENSDFNKKTKQEQLKLKKHANLLRTYLLDSLRLNLHTTVIDSAVYDALLLLAKCFPLNKLNEENEILSSVNDSTVLGENYFVAANGYWFSTEEVDAIYTEYEQNDKKNESPFFLYTLGNNEPFVVRDFDRFYNEFIPNSPEKQKFFSEEAIPSALLTSAMTLAATLTAAILSGAFAAVGGWIFLIGTGMIIAGYMAGFGLYYLTASVKHNITNYFDNKAGQKDAAKDKDRDTALELLPTVVSDNDRVGPAMQSTVEDVSHGTHHLSSGSAFFAHRRLPPREQGVSSQFHEKKSEPPAPGSPIKPSRQ